MNLKYSMVSFCMKQFLTKLLQNMTTNAISLFDAHSKGKITIHNIKLMIRRFNIKLIIDGHLWKNNNQVE
ncbi:hypothetical protein HanRHA438_Chr11g0528761 [Helianthus annuus]|nr:hypothetical protein HanIR_Chr11g0555911 [Helianthus annuus]KAJ0872880.1 hypothetical protein HanRHA438_Chr11g0528761 [Helianthus annuus]